MKVFLDIETTGLKPERSKIITAQIKIGNNDIIVLKEWELGEKNLIRKLMRLLTIVKNKPVYTYNGSQFDFPFLAYRISMLFSGEEKEKLSNIEINHHDLLQTNSEGYWISLTNLCKAYGIKNNSPVHGGDVPRLYLFEQYDEIIEHGKDDIYALIKLLEILNKQKRGIYDE